MLLERRTEFNHARCQLRVPILSTKLIKKTR